VSEQEPIEQARVLYERAVFGGDAEALSIAEATLDHVEADLALARGRILHARFLEQRHEDPRELPLFQRAVELYRTLGDVRGEAESLFWVGCFHQVVRDDSRAARAALEKSYELAVQAGDKLTMSYAARHLGFAELAADRTDTARERLEQSVRLRREIEFMPGVAAGLVALAHLSVAEGNRDEALSLLVEAGSIAEQSGAHGILRWVEQARAEL
jgi:tetratricopeptide (TPR) repeat protein